MVCVEAYDESLYVSTHTYTHIYIHTYTHTNTHKHIHMFMYVIYMYTNIIVDPITLGYYII